MTAKKEGLPASDLHGAQRQTGLQYCSPLYRPAGTILGHRVLSFCGVLGVCSVGRPLKQMASPTQTSR